MNDLGYKAILAAVIVLILAIIGYYVFYDPVVEQTGPQPTAEPTATPTEKKPVTSFDECIAAGYPILESYPEKCVTPAGRAFTREDANAPLPSSDPDAVFCTQDAMECPDGSFVGRVPPNCDFADCLGN